MPAQVKLPWTRDERGEADPWLVLVSLAVSVLILGGVTTALTHTQKWAQVYAVDAAQQHAEDGAAAAWTDDVGASSAIVPGGTITLPASHPAAKRTARVTLNSTLNATTAVRFDKGTQGGPCVATAWWITPGTQVNAGTSKNRTDNDRPRIAGPDKVYGNADDTPYYEIHRQQATYAATLANGRCNTGAAPTSASGEFRPVRTADPNAHVEYFNGINRDLHFAAGTEQGVAASSATKPSFWGATEWADATPTQVNLVMSIDHEVTGKGLGLQSASQAKTVPQQTTGNPNAGFLDGKDDNPTGGSEDNPDPAPGPTDPPTVTAVNAAQAENDTVTITRTDTRQLDGFEAECREYDNEAMTTPAGGRAMPRQSIASASAVTLASTDPGKTYTCRQTGWVKTSVGATVTTSAPNSPASITAAAGLAVGKVYTSPVFGPWSDPATRRAIAPSLSISVPGDTAAAGGTALYNDGTTAGAVVTWPVVPGASSYEVRYRFNGAAYSAPIPVAASATPKWTSPTVPEDTLMDVRVQSVNAGGTSDLPGRATVHAENRVDAPSPTMPNPAEQAQTATWPNEAGAVTWDVQWADNGTWNTVLAPRTARTASHGVHEGDSVTFRARGTGDNTGTGRWGQVGPYTREVNPPTGIAIADQDAGQDEGNATAVVEASCSDGTQLQVMWEDERGNDRGWSTSRSAAAAMREGQSNQFHFTLRCVNTDTNVKSDTRTKASSTLTRPYTAPSTPGISDSGDGNVGTDVTFSWTDVSGVYSGWYQLVDSSYDVRYEGSSRSKTVDRETGSTCGRVRAAKVDGAPWSSWSSLTCATTIVPTPPLSPSISGRWVPHLNHGLNAAYATVGSRSGATKYAARARFAMDDGTYTWSNEVSVSPGDETQVQGSLCSAVDTVWVEGQAGNAYGWSVWNGTTAIRSSNPLNTCID